MKRITINLGFVGIVYKNGNYQRFLTEGKHWLGFGEELALHSLSVPFAPRLDLNVYFKDSELKKLLHIIEVLNNQIVLVFKDKIFQKVLTSGIYAYWNSLCHFEFTSVDLSSFEIPDTIPISLLQHPEVNAYVRAFTVDPNEMGILHINGNPVRQIGAGVYRFWKNHELIQVIKADLRQLAMEISGQELLTKDKAAIRINFDAQYKTVDVVRALLENKDYNRQLYIALQLSLRKFVGMYTLDELLENKESISVSIKDDIKEVASNLGVEVLNTGVRDIILPGDVKEIMNQVLIATKKAQANVIMRREETSSTRNLLNTAKLMSENEMLFKLKEMEYVEKIADKISSISISGGSMVVDQLKDIFMRK